MYDTLFDDLFDSDSERDDVSQHPYDLFHRLGSVLSLSLSFYLFLFLYSEEIVLSFNFFSINIFSNFQFGGSGVVGKTASQYEMDEGIFLRCPKFKDWIGEDLGDEVLAALGFLACEYISSMTQLALSIQSSIRPVDTELKDIQVSLGTHQPKRNIIRYTPSTSIASQTIHTERPQHIRRSHTPLMSVHLLEAHRQLRPLSASQVQLSSCRSCW